MKRLKQLRIAKHWSQQRLAHKIGVSRSTISMWEIEASEPDKKALIDLANIFNTSVDYLLERTDYSDDKNREICNKISFLLENGQKTNTKLYVPGDVITEIRKGMYKFTRQSLGYIADYFCVGINTFLENDSYDEAEEYLEILRTRPEMKMIFNTAKDATKEELERADEVLGIFKKLDEEKQNKVIGFASALLPEEIKIINTPYKLAAFGGMQNEEVEPPIEEKTT